MDILGILKNHQLSIEKVSGHRNATPNEGDNTAGKLTTTTALDLEYNFPIANRAEQPNENAKSLANKLANKKGVSGRQSGWYCI